MFSPPNKCPFCGVTVEDPTVVGANFQACVSCPDTMTRWLDTHYWILSDTDHRVFTYHPLTDAWNRQRQPTALTTESTATHLSPADLTADELELVQTLATDGVPRWLEKVDAADLDANSLQALAPPDLATAELSDSVTKALRAQVPQPTIITGAAPTTGTIYTVDDNSLTDALTSRNTGTEQQTLG